MPLDLLTTIAFEKDLRRLESSAKTSTNWRRS